MPPRRQTQGKTQPKSTRNRERPTPSPLGTWIRNVRTEQGLSQRGLADRSGLSRSYLCDIERGRGHQPSVETLDKLSAALGFARDELMRAAGMIESAALDRQTSEERRLLAVFRDLDAAGREQVMRFTRFVHADAHAWVQSGLIEDRAWVSPTPIQRGQTLFELDPEAR